MLDKLDKLNDSMTVGKGIKCNRSRQSTSCEQGYLDDLQRYLKTRYTYLTEKTVYTSNFTLRNINIDSSCCLFPVVKVLLMHTVEMLKKG